VTNRIAQHLQRGIKSKKFDVGCRRKIFVRIFLADHFLFSLIVQSKTSEMILVDG